MLRLVELSPKDDFPQDDPVVASLKESLAKRADMRVVGYSYTQERSFDVLQGAAQNEGTSGSFAGAGIGLGLGTAVGGAFGSTFAQTTGSILNTAPQSTTGQSCCVKCHAPLLGGGKFCPECGAAQFVTCCGKTFPATIKFCPECGKRSGNQTPAAEEEK